MATTAVVAGTATVASRAVGNSMDNRAQAKADQQYAEQAAAQQQAQSAQDVEQMKAQLQQLQAQQAASALGAAGSDDILARLERLKTLQDSGVLSQSEFDAAKARLLAG